MPASNPLHIRLTYSIFFLHLTFNIGGVVLQHLLDWVKLHFTEADSLAAKVIEASDDEIQVNEDYWSAVSYGCIIKGSLYMKGVLLSS